MGGEEVMLPPPRDPCLLTSSAESDIIKSKMSGAVCLRCLTDRTSLKNAIALMWIVVAQTAPSHSSPLPMRMMLSMVKRVTCITGSQQFPLRYQTLVHNHPVMSTSIVSQAFSSRTISTTRSLVSTSSVPRRYAVFNEKKQGMYRACQTSALLCTLS